MVSCRVRPPLIVRPHDAHAGGDGTCGPLFVIERSLNANVVLYEAGLRPDGTLDPERPVHVTWRLDAEDGRREGLNLIERMRASLPVSECLDSPR